MTFTADIERIKHICRRYSQEAVRFYFDNQLVTYQNDILWLKIDNTGDLRLAKYSKKEDKFTYYKTDVENYFRVRAEAGIGGVIKRTLPKDLYAVRTMPEMRGVNLISQEHGISEELYFNKNNTGLITTRDNDILQFSSDELKQIQNNYFSFNVFTNHQLALEYLNSRTNISASEERRIRIFDEFVPILIRFTHVSNVYLDDETYLRFLSNTYLFADVQKLDIRTLRGKNINNVETNISKPGYIIYTTRKRISQTYNFMCREYEFKFYSELFNGLFSDEFPNKNRRLYMQAVNPAKPPILNESQYLDTDDKDLYRPISSLYWHLRTYIEKLGYRDKDLDSVYERLKDLTARSLNAELIEDTVGYII